MLASSFLLQLFLLVNLVQIKTTEKVSTPLGSHIYFKLWLFHNLFRALVSPKTWSAPAEVCHGSKIDRITAGEPRRGGEQAQKTESQAFLLHREEMRTDRKETTLRVGSKRNFSYIPIALFMLPKHIHILNDFSPFRNLLLNTVGFC